MKKFTFEGNYDEDQYDVRAVGGEPFDVCCGCVWVNVRVGVGLGGWRWGWVGFSMHVQARWAVGRGRACV